MSSPSELCRVRVLLVDMVMVLRIDWLFGAKRKSEVIQSVSRFGIC